MREQFKTRGAIEILLLQKAWSNDETCCFCVWSIFEALNKVVSSVDASCRQLSIFRASKAERESINADDSLIQSKFHTPAQYQVNKLCYRIFLDCLAILILLWSRERLWRPLNTSKKSFMQNGSTLVMPSNRQIITLSS